MRLRSYIRKVRQFAPQIPEPRCIPMLRTGSSPPSMPNQQAVSTNSSVRGRKHDKKRTVIGSTGRQGAPEQPYTLPEETPGRRSKRLVVLLSHWGPLGHPQRRPSQRYAPVDCCCLRNCCWRCWKRPGCGRAAGAGPQRVQPPAPRGSLARPPPVATSAGAPARTVSSAPRRYYQLSGAVGVIVGA